MPMKDVVKISRKTFFNPSAWLDVESISAQNGAIWTILKSLFTPNKSGRKETFAEAVERQGLTEEDIKDAQESYTAYAIVFLLLGIGLVVFAFYLLFFHKSFHAWLISLAAAAFTFTQAFRFDFLAFQIKNRKLGCTFAEWKNRKVNG